LLTFLAGPGYDWAVIAGGQPKKLVSEVGCDSHHTYYKLFGQCHMCPAAVPQCGNTLCENGEGVNDSGLWVFSSKCSIHKQSTLRFALIWSVC
jgi:hypothetical protein